MGKRRRTERGIQGPRHFGDIDRVSGPYFISFKKDGSAAGEYRSGPSSRHRDEHVTGPA